MGRNGSLETTRGKAGRRWDWRVFVKGSVAMQALCVLVGLGFAVGAIRWLEARPGSSPVHVRLADVLVLLGAIGGALLGQMSLARGLARRLREREALTQLGEKTVGIAHGWKNAVHSLRGFTALLESQVGGREDVLEVLQGLRLAIDQVADLTRTTLESSAAPPAGRSCLRGPELPRHVEAVTKGIASCFPGISLRTYYSRLPSGLALPPGVLSEVLTNLLRNAAEAMQGKGEIQLCLRTADDRFTVEIRDHGLGISEDDVDKLFQPGFTTKPGGSGFGLFHTRNLLRAYDGDVMALRGARGGAVFVVEVPAREACIHERPFPAHC